MIIQLTAHPNFPVLSSRHPDVQWFNWAIGPIQGKSNGHLAGEHLRLFLEQLPEELRAINYDPSFSRYLVPNNVHYAISPWYQSMLFKLESKGGRYERANGDVVQLQQGHYYLVDLTDRFRFIDSEPVEYLGVKFKTSYNDVMAICKTLGYITSEQV